MDNYPEAQDLWPTSDTQVLRNPLLVHMILGRLPIESVVSLRLVNKTWNEIAISVLKKEGPYITLESDDSELEQFVDSVQPSKKFPFTKLTIQLSSVLNDTAWNGVLRSVAPFLSHLNVTGPWRDAPVRVGPFLASDIRLPKLKELSIHLDEEEDELVFLSQIIAVSPNLKILQIRNAGHRVLQQLTRLPGLKLEKLTLECENQHYEDVGNLLMSQRNSLLELSISASNVRRFVEVDTLSYTLPKLKTLRLEECGNFPPNEDDNEFSPDAGNLRRLEYAKKFPNLKQLQLYRSSKLSNPKGIGFNDFFAVKMRVPCTSVTTLRLGHLTTMESQDAMVECIPKCFPNITSLEVTAGFKKVVELMAKLKHLETITLSCHSYMGTSVDPILGGLNVKDWKKQGKMLDHPPYSAWHKIRTLYITFVNKRFPVSEATCRLVLLQMKNLKEVHIKGRLPREREISAALMKEMGDNFHVFFPIRVMTD